MRSTCADCTLHRGGPGVWHLQGDGSPAGAPIPPLKASVSHPESPGGSPPLYHLWVQSCGLKGPLPLSEGLEADPGDTFHVLEQPTPLQAEAWGLLERPCQRDGKRGQGCADTSTPATRPPQQPAPSCPSGRQRRSGPEGTEASAKGSSLLRERVPASAVHEDCKSAPTKSFPLPYSSGHAQTAVKIHGTVNPFHPKSHDRSHICQQTRKNNTYDETEEA